MKKDHVFFPTISQSGTWFVAKILHWRAGYIFKRFKIQVKKEDLGNLPLRTTVHAHILGEVALHEIRSIYNVLNKNEKCLMVVPIRDVLLSVLSRKRRFPEVSANHIIDAYVLVAQKFKEYDPFYFPVDLYTDPKDREGLLTALEEALGVKLSDINSLDKKRFAGIWPPENESRDFCLEKFGDPRMEFKQAYELKELAYLQHVISEEWAYLSKKQNILQPFFEGLGYRNLLWYKKKK